jgi:GTP cyclohydrolase I
MKDKTIKKYEWVGDVESYKEPTDNEHSVKYNEPDRDYDSDYNPTKADIETFPDLQNGPSSLIQGAPVAIQQVGIHNFRLPLKYKKRDGGDIELETKVTGTVSLSAHKKGINMSRIMRSFYKFKDDYVFGKLDDILLKYKDDLESFDAKIGLH